MGGIQNPMPKRYCNSGLGRFGGGLNWSGVDPPLSSSRACLTTFIAISVP